MAVFWVLKGPAVKHVNICESAGNLAHLTKSRLRFQREFHLKDIIVQQINGQAEHFVSTTQQAISKMIKYVNNFFF